MERKISIDEAYAMGYEDGYDQGCMDMLDDDLGENSRADAEDGEEE